MDLSTGVLLLVVAVLAINQAAMRVPRLREDDRVYWAVQAIDAAVAAAILCFGLPGFEAFPAVPVILALLFALHFAQNANARARRERDRRQERIRAEREAWAAREAVEE